MTCTNQNVPTAWCYNICTSQSVIWIFFMLLLRGMASFFKEMFGLLGIKQISHSIMQSFWISAFIFQSLNTVLSWHVKNFLKIIELTFLRLRSSKPLLLLMLERVRFIVQQVLLNYLTISPWLANQCFSNRSGFFKIKVRGSCNNRF